MARVLSESAARYLGRRDAAREMTLERMYELARLDVAPTRILTGLDLREIDDEALELSQGWGFPWRKIVGQFRPYDRRFEVAVWCGRELCGLAVGRASKGKRNVTIHFIERSADQNPFAGAITLIVTECAYRYAQILGSEWLIAKNPVPEMVPTYERLFFALAGNRKGSTYYAREIR